MLWIYIIYIIYTIGQYVCEGNRMIDLSNDSIFYCGDYNSNNNSLVFKNVYDFSINNKKNFFYFQENNNVGNITVWIKNIKKIKRKFKFLKRKKIFIGHGFGGYLGLLENRNYFDKYILLSPDFDYFVEKTSWLELSDFIKSKISNISLNTVVFNKQQIEDSIKYRLLNKEYIRIKSPVYISHCTNDDISDFHNSIKFYKKLKTKDKQLNLISNCDHNFLNEERNILDKILPYYF